MKKSFEGCVCKIESDNYMFTEIIYLQPQKINGSTYKTSALPIVYI